MTGKVLLTEISKIIIENYEGADAFRQNGIVTINKVTKQGVYYTKLGEKQELYTSMLKGFMTPAVFLPYAPEDEQFQELHRYSWEEAMRYFPKNTNGTFMAGLQINTSLINLIQDGNGFWHLSKLSFRRANVAGYKASAAKLARELEEDGI